MATDPSSQHATGDQPAFPSQAVRTVLSLLLIVHLFCLFVVISSNMSRSPLQDRLVSRLSQYTRLLHLDPNYTTFHLTHAERVYDNHGIEVVLVKGDRQTETVSLTGIGRRGGNRRQRYQSLGYVMAFFTYREDDTTIAEFAKAVGASVLRQHDVDKVLVRLRHHRPSPLQIPLAQRENNPDDPNAPQYYQTIYEAEVWIDKTGLPQLLKKSSAAEVAAPDRQRKTRDDGDNKKE